MTRTSNIGDVARQIRDQHKIPLTAAKSIARALATRGLLYSSAGWFVERPAAVAREQGGKITPEQASASWILAVPGTGEAVDEKLLEHLSFPLRLREPHERIAYRWAANRDVEPRLTLGQFQAPLHESTVLTGIDGSGRSYALTNMLLRLCSEHGPDQVQLLIGESYLPAVGRRCSDLPHTVRAFDHMERGVAPFISKLRYELSKRRKLWREDRERFNQLPWLLIVLDGFSEVDWMSAELRRLLDRVRGYNARASVLMTLHRVDPQWGTDTVTPRNQLEFGSWSFSGQSAEVPAEMMENLRHRLGHPKFGSFVSGSWPEHEHHAIWTRTEWQRPVTSRVIDSPAFDNADDAAVPVAAIRAATAVKDLGPVTAARRPTDSDPEEFDEDRVPKGSRIHDVYFPGLSVRLVQAIADDPERALAQMDLHALLPTASEGGEAVLAVWVRDRSLPVADAQLVVRVVSSGSTATAAVEAAIRSAHDAGYPCCGALWKELTEQQQELDR